VHVPHPARNPAITEHDLREQLRNWMRRDPTVAEYLSIRDVAAIGKLTPERLRVHRYEEVIEILVAELAPSAQ
jgi:hypothetical protein